MNKSLRGEEVSKANGLIVIYLCFITTSSHHFRFQFVRSIRTKSEFFSLALHRPQTTKFSIFSTVRDYQTNFVQLSVDACRWSPTFPNCSLDFHFSQDYLPTIGCLWTLSTMPLDCPNHRHYNNYRYLLPNQLSELNLLNKIFSFDSLSIFCDFPNAFVYLRMLCRRLSPFSI